MPNQQPHQPVRSPRNWLELASVERQIMEHFAAARERAGELATANDGQSPSAQARRARAQAMHDERMVQQNIARAAYLGALGAHVERRNGSFAPDQLPQREVEAKLAGHVIGSFVTAAQLLTGVDSLRRNGLATTAVPLAQGAVRALERGFAALRLQQAGHEQDKQRLPAGLVYVPPLPTTIMNVVIQEVPALSVPHRVALLHKLLPQTPGRN